MSLERKLGLKDDESLLTVARASGVTLILPGLAVAMLLLAPLFFMVPLLRLETLGMILMGLSASLGLFFGLRGYMKWRLSILAVTEKRLIIVRQGGFFDRHVTELPYARIQEVAYRVKGLWATIFRYGDLLVESAANDEPVAMRRLPHPARVHGLITELQGGGAGRGDFGEILQAVSRMDARQLHLLKSEIERTQRLLPPGQDA